MSWVNLDRRADKNRCLTKGPERVSLRGFLYPASPRHMPFLTPNSWAPLLKFRYNARKSPRISPDR